MSTDEQTNEQHTDVETIYQETRAIRQIIGLHIPAKLKLCMRTYGQSEHRNNSSFYRLRD